MKAILMSIQPQWVEKILSGEKTIEVRKTASKETPFKVYVYCTKGKENLYIPQEFSCFEQDECSKPYFAKEPIIREYDYLANGKAVAEFICKYPDRRSVKALKHSRSDYNHFCVRAGCKPFEHEEIDKYIENSEFVYAYHITDLKIYDKPKELSEFQKRDCGRKCNYLCEYYENKLCGWFVERAAQSWFYVKELK